MISKCSQDGTLQGREGQALIKATVTILDSECVYECECVYMECAFWYLQEKAGHGGNKLCKSKSDLRSTSLNLAE